MHFPVRSRPASRRRLQRAFDRFNPNRSNSLQWHAEHPMPRHAATVVFLAASSAKTVPQSAKEAGWSCHKSLPGQEISPVVPQYNQAPKRVSNFAAARAGPQSEGATDLRDYTDACRGGAGNFLSRRRLGRNSWGANGSAPLPWLGGEKVSLQAWRQLRDEVISQLGGCERCSD